MIAINGTRAYMLRLEETKCAKNQYSLQLWLNVKFMILRFSIYYRYALKGIIYICRTLLREAEAYE